MKKNKYTGMYNINEPIGVPTGGHSKRSEEAILRYLAKEGTFVKKPSKKPEKLEWSDKDLKTHKDCVKKLSDFLEARNRDEKPFAIHVDLEGDHLHVNRKIGEEEKSEKVQFSHDMFARSTLGEMHGTALSHVDDEKGIMVFEPIVKQAEQSNAFFRIFRMPPKGIHRP